VTATNCCVATSCSISWTSIRFLALVKSSLVTKNIFYLLLIFHFPESSSNVAFEKRDGREGVSFASFAAGLVAIRDEPNAIDQSSPELLAKPMHLIEIDKKSRLMKVNEEALAKLRELESNVKIFSVVGTYRYEWNESFSSVSFSLR